MLISSATAKAFAQVTDCGCVFFDYATLQDLFVVPEAGNVWAATESRQSDPSIRGNEMVQKKNCKFNNAMA